MTTEQAIHKMRDVMRLRHLSHATEQSYCGWLVRFARFVSERCDPMAKPEQLQCAQSAGIYRTRIRACSRSGSNSRLK